MVGLPGLAVGAIAVSDARVSFCDRNTGHVIESWDGVQKIHEVAPNILMGFAGSIYLGFKCVSDFAHFLGPNPTRRFVKLEEALIDWAGDLRDAWRDPKQVPPEEASGGCHLLFLGVDPTKNVGDISWWPVTSGFIVRAPDFDIEAIPGTEPGSIGSGSGKSAYLAVLERLATNWIDISNFSAVPVRDLGPLFVATLLQDAIQRAPSATVGNALHMGSVTRDRGVYISALRTRALQPGGHSVTMPPVAQTWDEFVKMVAPSIPSGASAIG